MNSKQFGILIALVVVLGAAGLWIYKKGNDSSGAGDPTLGRKLLAGLAVNDVAAISIKQGTNALTLAKKDGTWRVAERNDYPANYNDISDFLLKTREIKVLETEKVGAADLTRLSLAEGVGSNSATQVEFKDQGNKALQTLLLGKKHMRKAPARPSPMGMGEEGWPDGRYVTTKGSPDSVMLISDPLMNIEPRPEQWLSKEFFKVEKLRSLAVTFAEATNSWKMTRETETGDWKLAEPREGETLDSSKVASLSSSLSSPTFVDVAISSSPESLGLDKATNIVAETFDNLTYTIKVGQKTGDNYPVTLALTAQLPKERAPGKDEKPEDKTRLDKEFTDAQKKLEEKIGKEKFCEKWIYLVSGWSVDPMLKHRSELLAEKKEPTTGESNGTNAVPATVNETQ